MLGTLGQTCVSGVLLDLMAFAVIYYLWWRDRSEGYLAFWSTAHLFSAARWMLTYPAVVADSLPAQALAALCAGATITLNLVGAYSLTPERRVGLRALGGTLFLLCIGLTVAGLWLGRVLTIFGVASLFSWAVGAWLFWRAHRHNPLSAYRIAVGAMCLNVAIWIVGFAVLGRGFVTSIILPLTALPTMIAFFIIAHQRALAKARDSEQTMDALFNTVPIPIVISRPPEGRVERINQRALEVFGMDAKDYVGRNGLESGVIADRAARDWIYAELAGGRDVRNREMTFPRGQKEPLLASVNASRVELRDGLRYVFTLYDLTDLRRVEHALKELNVSLEQQVQDRTRDLESFSYSVSHDLRAPLRAIDSFSALLAEEAGDTLSGPARDYLARIRDNCRRMSQLIEAMIGLAQHGAARLDPTLVDISAMAEELAGELRQAEPQRQVEVRIEPWMRSTADRNATRIVLDNLLRNAWKYSARTPQALIEVGCDSADGNRVYFVRDNGAGFDMRAAGDLFKPFVRLHTAAEFEGSGIGLATVARVIRNLGGRIWAEARVGVGATFRFTLGPAETRQRSADAARSAA